MFLEKYALLRDANQSFLFSIRELYFCDLMEFRQFAHRKHCQSDAGMNLAFLSSMELLVELFLSHSVYRFSATCNLLSPLYPRHAINSTEYLAFVLVVHMIRSV